MKKPKFTIEDSEDGQFYYKLIAPNGKCIGTGETHPSKQKVKEEIESVRENVPKAIRVDNTKRKSNPTV
jgi:uncharacterized protein